MTKEQILLFSVKYTHHNFDMYVDKVFYNHFLTLTPHKQKAIQDMMALQLLNQHFNE